MAKQRITEHISVDFKYGHNPERQRILKSPEMVAYLDSVGSETVSRCNADLHAAQAARNQPQEDGYDHRVSTQGTRARLYIAASTARGMAHEAVNQSILKNIPVGDVKNVQPPDPEIPRELGRRGAESSGWGQ